MADNKDTHYIHSSSPLSQSLLYPHASLAKLFPLFYRDISLLTLFNHY